MALTNITYTDYPSKHARRVVYTATFDDRADCEHVVLVDAKFSADKFLPVARTIILEGLQAQEAQAKEEANANGWGASAARAIDRMFPKEVIIEKRVEVPVDRIVEVEKIVEVPVEVRIEVPVERVVEVEKPVYVDKIVEHRIEVPVPYPVEVECVVEVPGPTIEPTLRAVWDKWLSQARQYWASLWRNKHV